MQQKVPRVTTGQAILIGLAVSLVLSWVFRNNNPQPSASATPPTAQTPPATVDQPVASSQPPADSRPERPVTHNLGPGSLKAYIIQMANHLGGISSNLDGKPARVRSVTVGEEFTIVGLVPDDNLTSGLIRAGVLDFSTKLFRSVFTERPDAPKTLILQWYFPMQDVKGNTQVTPIITVTLSKESAATFNWSQFTYSNLPKAADSYVESPAFGQ